jgi:hypothetical protein
MSRGLNPLVSRVFDAGPARYRSKTTGRYVSEDWSREHSDEAYPVNRSVPRLALAAALVGIGLAVSAGIVYRSRR